MTDRFNDPRPIIYTSITFPWLPVFLGRMHYTASSYPARPCLHEEAITFAKGRWDSCHRQDVSHRFASWSGLCCVLWFAQWSSTTAVFSICIYLFLVSSYCVESVLYIWLRPNLLIGVFLRRFLPGEEAHTRTRTHAHLYIYDMDRFVFHVLPSSLAPSDIQQVWSPWLPSAWNPANQRHKGKRRSSACHRVPQPPCYACYGHGQPCRWRRKVMLRKTWKIWAALGQSADFKRDDMFITKRHIQ